MAPGDSIAGKYNLIRPVGKGSMGEVWAALHVEMRRTVALKLIYEGSLDLAMRLKREALACGQLEHANIVRVYDIGETSAGDPFLVMELLQGETLAQRLARGQRLTPAEALEIALQIARGLRAAHGSGVVHRDLKPANIYLHRGPGAEAEQVKVLDFGVSKLLELDEAAVTVTGALVGSPAYMSPEAARALKQIDPRADLWSLGVLLFEMLGGSRPFGGVTVFGVIAEILTAPIPTLASVLPGVDPRLDAAVARCLTRELEQRVPSAAALIDALEPVLASVRATGSVLWAPSASAPALAVAADALETSTIAWPVTGGGEPAEEEAETLVLRSAEPEAEGTTTEMQGTSALAFRREITAKLRARDALVERMLVPLPFMGAEAAPAPPIPQDRSGPGPDRDAPPPPDPGRATLPPGWERSPGASYVPLITALSVLAVVLLVVIARSLLSQASDPAGPPRAAPSAAGGQAR